MARRMDRRELLQGGAGLAIAAGLAGCGVGNSGGSSKEETEKPIKKRVAATSSTSTTPSTSTRTS